MPIWKEIQGHPNYEVSDEGQIRSRDKTVTTDKGWSFFSKGRILKPWKGTSGYHIVQLTDNQRASVHRIVATAFIANPNNKPQVNHKNGNKLDNRVVNLEWMTSRENNMHAKEVGLHNDRVVVAQKDPTTGEVLATFRSLKEAAEATGINYSSLAYAARGKYKTSGGFIWERVTTIRKE